MVIFKKFSLLGILYEPKYRTSITKQGTNEFERAKIYYTKKVADNLLFIANPGNKAETPYKSGAKLEKMGYKQKLKSYNNL
ncbi:hypothetical protein HpMS178_03720 [Helicobacter pylori]